MLTGQPALVKQGKVMSCIMSMVNRWDLYLEHSKADELLSLADNVYADQVCGLCWLNTEVA